MPTKFTVERVANVGEFKNQRKETMYGFKLDCVRDDGQPETIEVNATTADRYKAGVEFWAEPKGTEYRGVKKYKAVQAPDAPPRGSQNAPQSPLAPATAVSAPNHKAMDYASASLLLKRCLDDFGPTGCEVVFRLILEGKIENPVRAKTIVRFMGQDIETDGITQLDWDVMMELDTRLTKETDPKNVRALLISTCGVMSRKNLTADKAKLFIEALRANLAKIEADRPPLDEDEGPPLEY
jgi:hypothetical protein